MSSFVWVTIGAFLLYLALRVVQLKRASLPFLIAYPLFVTVFLGGAAGVFIAASWASAALELEKEMSLMVTFGATLVGVVLLWIAARRMIG